MRTIARIATAAIAYVLVYHGVHALTAARNWRDSVALVWASGLSALILAGIVMWPSLRLIDRITARGWRRSLWVVFVLFLGAGLGGAAVVFSFGALSGPWGGWYVHWRLLLPAVVSGAVSACILYLSSPARRGAAFPSSTDATRPLG